MSPQPPTHTPTHTPGPRAAGVEQRHLDGHNCSSGGVTHIKWVETRDEAKHLTMHRTASQQSCLSPVSTGQRLENYALTQWEDLQRL